MEVLYCIGTLTDKVPPKKVSYEDLSVQARHNGLLLDNYKVHSI